MNLCAEMPTVGISELMPLLLYELYSMTSANFSFLQSKEENSINLCFGIASIDSLHLLVERGYGSVQIGQVRVPLQMVVFGGHFSGSQAF